MEFRDLKYILAVAKHRNITKAADELCVSQPSLSQLVHKVERQLGCELFHRGYRKLIPTTAGEEYIRTASLILHQREDLRQKINDMHEMRRGKLTLGITSQRGGHMLPSVISAFKRNYPGIELRVIEKLSTDDLEEMALEGECDVFVSCLPLTHTEITYRVLCDDCLYLVLPPTFQLEHPASAFSFERITRLLDSMRDTECIFPPSKMKLRRLMDSLFDIAGFKPRVMFETHNIDTAQFMVLGGVGYTFTMRTVCLDSRMMERPIYVPINDSRFRTLLVAGFSNRDYISNVAHCFIDEMKRIMKEVAD